jgi:hexosaminidase
VLSPQFQIELDINPAPPDLLAAISQTSTYLQNDKLERLVVGRGATDAAAIQGANTLPSLMLSLASGVPVRSISAEAVDPLESRDEGYTLSVPDDGTCATLKANSTLGLFRGLTTFAQLWYDSDGTTYTLDAPIQIADAPAFVRVVRCFYILDVTS